MWNRFVVEWAFDEKHGVGSGPHTASCVLVLFTAHDKRDQALRHAHADARDGTPNVTNHYLS